MAWPGPRSIGLIKYLSIKKTKIFLENAIAQNASEEIFHSRVGLLFHGWNHEKNAQINWCVRGF